ncbi:hypothetical protein PC116_g6034 [Phytophthora cactorum]|nr:hypothetical protein PC116_g6034 [Phytophthora cactorum]
MTEKKDVAYRPLGHRLVYYFSWDNMNGYVISDTPRAGRAYGGLFDGNEADGALDYELFHHVFLFASPSNVNYKNFAKEKCFHSQICGLPDK